MQHIANSAFQEIDYVVLFGVNLRQRAETIIIRSLGHLAEDGRKNMMNQSPRFAKIIASALIISTVTACALPRPGPSKNEIFQAGVVEGSNTEVILVNESVTRAVALPPEPGFPSALTNAGPAAPDRIRAGDTLSFTIYENIDDGVLSRGGANTSSLQSLQVDDAGFIFIPYAGRIRASGQTPDGLRRIVTEKLAALTPEPQVLVQRASGDGATVSVLGDGIADQGVYPIQRSSRRLMEMVATAGGLVNAPEVSRIAVLRNQTKGEIWFEDVFENPEYDIALHAGDRVLVQRDPRTFTALGAVGTQANVPFALRELSALEALAQVGGLDGSVSDPTGLFVIRNQDEATARRLFGRSDIQGEQSIVFVLDLTQPNGIPLAGDFDMRDGDTIYVTEAPFVQWNKAIRGLVGTAGAVLTVESLAN